MPLMSDIASEPSLVPTHRSFKLLNVYMPASGFRSLLCALEYSLARRTVSLSTLLSLIPFSAWDTRYN